jgi:hypothetical protein
MHAALTQGSAAAQRILERGGGDWLVGNARSRWLI